MSKGAEAVCDVGTGGLAGGVWISTVSERCLVGRAGSDGGTICGIPRDGSVVNEGCGIGADNTVGLGIA